MFVVLPLWDYVSGYPRIDEMLEFSKSEDGYTPKLFATGEEAEAYKIELREYFHDKYDRLGHCHEMITVIEIEDNPKTKSANKKDG